MRLGHLLMYVVMAFHPMFYHLAFFLLILEFVLPTACERKLHLNLDNDLVNFVPTQDHVDDALGHFLLQR